MEGKTNRKHQQKRSTIHIETGVTLETGFTSQFLQRFSSVVDFIPPPSPNKQSITEREERDLTFLDRVTLPRLIRRSLFGMLGRLNSSGFFTLWQWSTLH